MTRNYKKLRSPLRYVGGKGKMRKKVLSLFPPHHTYVEACGGGGSVMFGKDPNLSQVEVYNDLDLGLHHFFYVLRTPELFARFYHLVTLTPYSRKVFQSARRSWQKIDDPVERAYYYFLCNRMSFGGNFQGGWSNSITTSKRGMASVNSAWLSTLEQLPLIHQRLMRVQIECRDILEVISIYDRPETLFYLDPPYVLSTRHGKYYSHEMSDEQHQALVAKLLTIKGKAIVSGYAHEIYQPLEEAGWEVVDFPVSSTAASKPVRRVERVWISPRAQKQKD